MLTKESTRVSAIDVDVLDLKGLCWDVLAHLAGSKHAEGVRSLTAGWGWARATTKAGMYVLNTEGVGPAHPIKERNWSLVLYRYPQGVAYGPFMRVRITPRELMGLPVKERVPLTQFIRMVGPTLERNFQTWNERLTTAGVGA